MNDASIDEWVVRAQNGVIDAITFLYLNHYQRIYRYLFFRAGDPQTAEDLTSEVFLKMIQALPHYQKQNVPFQAWLFQIARNLAIDYHRKKASHPNVELQDDFLDERQPVDVAQEINFTYETLNKAFDKLTDDQRDVVLLRFVEGMSLSQVGKVLHKSEDSIKGLQHRALIALRQELQRQEEDHG